MDNPIPQNTNTQSPRRKKIIILAIIAAVILTGAVTWAVLAKTMGGSTDPDNPDAAKSGIFYDDTGSEGVNTPGADDSGKKADSKKSDKASSSKKTLAKSTKPGSNKPSPGGGGGGDTKTPTPKPPKPPTKQSPLLLKHGWDVPFTSFVASNVSSMEKMPFDGVVMRMNSSLSSRIHTQTPVSYSTLQSSLASVKNTNFNKFKHNFLLIYSADAGDIFDDYSTVVSNFANVARAAKEAGFKGIIYDNEDYCEIYNQDECVKHVESMEYGANCDDGTYTVSQCRDRAYLRGAQIMKAMRQQWSDVQLMILRGPTISEAKTAGYIQGKGIAYNDIAWANLLAGSFAIGMVSETVGNNAQFIDGGELYSLRTLQNFKDMKWWQKQGMGSQSSLIPPSLKLNWANTVKSSFGVYDFPALENDAPMNPSIWKSTLTNALNTADRYVWAYTERHDWWGTGWPEQSVPSNWITATRDAVNATR